MFYAIKTFLSETTVALLDNDKRPFTFYWIRTEDINLGDIYLGRVVKKMPEQKGYFIEIDHKRNLFLSTKHSFENGQPVLVYISKEERLGKIPQCKCYDAQTKTPQNIIGLIKKGELFAGISNSEEYQQTEWIEEFDDALNDSLDKIVPFANGARLIFEQTHAFHSIDVDSGNSSEPLDSLNTQAATKIAQEIIRRNLSGNILIDFIGNKKKSTVSVWKNILSKELSKSPVPFHFFGISPMGNLEIRRNRMRMSTTDATRNISACAYDLFKEILKQPTRVKSAQVSLELYAAITGVFNETWKSVQAKTGKTIPLSAVTDLSTFEVEFL